MPWLSINPNSLDSEIKAVCAEILGHPFTDPASLTPTQVASAFNILDPELCRLTTSDTDRRLMPSEDFND